MPELGRLTAIFDADTSKFDAGARGVGAKILALDSNFKGLTGSASSAIGTLSGMAGPMALAAGGAVALASAVSGVAVGLFNLVKSSAKVGGELFDLSQKTSFAVETLSSLSIVAKTTGGDINSISASLGIFQKNMVAAQDVTSKQGELFKRLNIDVNDNEKALRQAFTALSKMQEGAKQTATAMALFGRSGKDVLAIVKETNGDLDEATKRFTELGLVIGTDAAKAADVFNDQLELVTQQLEAVTREIGTQLLPTATKALTNISRYLQDNKEAWQSWGQTIANVVNGVMRVANSDLGRLVGWIANVSVQLNLLVNAARLLGAIGSNPAAGGPMSDARAKSLFGRGGSTMTDSLLGRTGQAGVSSRFGFGGTRSSIAGLPDFDSGGGGGGGGGGGRGGGRSGRAARMPGVPRSRSEADFMESLEELAPLLELITFSTKDWSIALEDTGKALEELFIKGGGGMGFLKGGDEGVGGGKGSAVGDFVNERLRDEMQSLGYDLSFIIGDSVEAGFREGGAKGLAYLAQGFLRIVQDIFLRRLAEGLSQVLGNLGAGVGGGGGGGFWGGLLKAVIGGAVGGAAGGAGGGFAKGGTFGGAGVGTLGKGFASGGYLPPGQWGVAGENGPEQIYGGMTGMSVVPGKGGNNITINLPPNRGGSYTSPQSQRQIAKRIASMLGA